MLTTTPKGILSLIRKGESDTVEFKQGFDRDVIETLAAFANSRGGRVFVGVSGSGEVVGIEAGKETVQNWVNHMSLGPHRPRPWEG